MNLPPDLMAELNEYAVLSGSTRDAVVATAIRKHLRDEAKARQMRELQTRRTHTND